MEGIESNAPSCPPQTQLRHSAYAGIQNLGNTCYMASALHALAATPALLGRLQAVAPPGGAATTVGTPVVDVVQGILQQPDPLYDAASGVPAAVDVKPLLDALAGSRS